MEQEDNNPLTTILNICQELCRDIYDLYAEYEEEEVQDQFVSLHLLLSPVKHLYLNINVGGTVSSSSRPKSKRSVEVNSELPICLETVVEYSDKVSGI